MHPDTLIGGMAWRRTHIYQPGGNENSKGRDNGVRMRQPEVLHLKQLQLCEGLEVCFDREVVKQTNRIGNVYQYQLWPNLVGNPFTVCCRRGTAALMRLHRV